MFTYLCVVALMLGGKLVKAQGFNLNLTNKPTWQSSEFKSGITGLYHSSSLAVDGCKKTLFKDKCCTHTALYEKKPWWSVDLGKVYTLLSVTLVNRKDKEHKRLKEFYIYGSETSHNASKLISNVSCTYHPSMLGSGETKKLSCEKAVQTRYVIIQKTDSQPLTLCEVLVEIDCPDGTFFEDNDCNSCSANCETSSCNKSSGACPCKPGYTGSQCFEECPEDTYGHSCKNCSENCNTTCDKFTPSGICISGCMPGYMGNNCTQDCKILPDCPDGTYGYPCKNCPQNCQGQKCERLTHHGSCTLGCIPGYMGDDCTQECPDGSYGNQCKECFKNCEEQKCDKFSIHGNCTVGCIPGYTGDVCMEECSDGTFGSGCQNCSKYCKDGLCNKFTKNGVCTNGCEDGYTGESCSQAVQVGRGQTKNSNSGVVAGTVVPLLFVIAVAIFLLFILRKRRSNKRKESSIQNAVDSPTNMIEEDILADTGDMYVNVPRVGTTFVTKLRNYVKQMQENKDIIKDEYENIPKTPLSSDYAKKAELKAKNRYKNILPYDNNRVVLPLLDNDPLTDYINASYIKDYHGNKSYIAALGPVTSTVQDTWRMIWECGISSIFMVTNPIEGDKMKCVQYWPSEDQANFGDISVKLQKHVSENHIITRIMEVMKDAEVRTVVHYHYTAWPDKQVPSSVSGIIKLRDLLKDERRQNGMAVALVHCSAGIGRTGTLIALDILFDQFETEGQVDVHQCVTSLRHQRTQMVQTLAQYRFLYETVFEYINVGITLMTRHEFKTLMTSDYQSRTSEEFQFLETVKPIFTKQELEFGKDENKEKNHDLNVVPAWNQRIKLEDQPELYINAVYVEGNNDEKIFCASQIPVQGTVGDFWKIILQEKCSAIVCLESTAMCAEWLPENRTTLSSDEITVFTKDVSLDDSISTFDIHIGTEKEQIEYANAPIIEDTESHNLKVYLLNNWDSQGLTPRDKIAIKTVYDEITSMTHCDQPVMVMCRNGADQTGLFIAASIVFDMLATTETVDFVQTVKQIRKNRPQFITDLV